MADGFLDYFFLVVGGITTFFVAYQLFEFFRVHFVRSSSLPRYMHNSEDPAARPWALITGASDGIGKGFAEELCSLGFNVIIHGRNAKKLENVKSELTAQWPKAEVRLAVLDAHPFTEEAMDNLVATVETLEITVLVNNVGGSGPVNPGFRAIQDLTPSELDTLMGINMRFPTHITKALLPTLVKNSPSLILNVGSFAAGLPSAYLTIYSGSKSYNQAWSASLAAEMLAQNHDVEVLGLMVGMVEASHNRESGTNFFKPSQRAFAKSALHKVGCGYALVTPYATHVLELSVFYLLPEWLRLRILIYISKNMKADYLKRL